MNDRSGEVRRTETPAFELPQAPFEQGVERSLEKAKESDEGHDKAISNVRQQQPAVVLPDDPLLQKPADDSTAIASAEDTAKHETEVIEKQWVERAKNVLSQYRDNPHKQKAELSKVKAAYLKTRFNKILKVEEAG